MKLPLGLQRCGVKRLGEIGRYALGCGLGIAIKIVITSVGTWLTLPVWCGYLAAQLVVLFFSFGYHSRVTFQRREPKKFGALLREFSVFFVSVLGFKLADYLLVVLGQSYLAEKLSEQGALSMEQQQLLISVCIIGVSAFLFALRYLLYRVLFRRKNVEPELEKRANPVEYYTGKVLQVRSGFAADSEISSNAASGGLVTALLADALKAGTIDGALVWTLDMGEGGAFLPTPIIARSREELMAAQGSIYFTFAPCTRVVREMVEHFDGKLAVVGLPCGLRAWRSVMERDAKLKSKIVLLVGLFCGHTSRKRLIEVVLERAGVPRRNIMAFRFRRGLWRGYSEAKMRDGSVWQRPTAFYNLYQNLFIQSAPQCWNCFDHFAEVADVSTGDVWSMAHRSDAVKHSICAIRTEVGLSCMDGAESRGALAMQESTPEALFVANRRAAVFHKAIRARAWAGRWFGMQISVPPEARRARWNELLAALPIVALYRFSIGKHGAWVLRMPRTLLKCLLYYFKGLTNF